jgi:hypothetical protein
MTIHALSRLICLCTALAVTGCSQPTLDRARILICEIHEVKSEVCGALGCTFNPGFRLTVTFMNEDRTEIAIGDVFGGQTVLKKVENKLYSGNDRDRNVVQFERKSPASEDRLMLNSVSGQMYFFAKVEDELTEEFYAHCDPALPNAR